VEASRQDPATGRTVPPPVLPGVTWAMSAGCIAMGAMALLGWTLGRPALVRVAPGFPSMKPATAVCFVLLGTALAGCVTRRWPARADLIAAGAAGCVVLLVLFEYATGRDVGVDHFPFTVPVAHGGDTGRVALATGLEILLLVAALGAHAAGWPRITQALCLIGLAGSMVAVLGYAYGARHLYSTDGGSAMQMHTAVGLAAVSIGLLAAVPHGVVPRLVRDVTPGAVIQRRLLPVVLLVLPLIGWFCLHGQHVGWFGAEFAVAVMVIAAAAVLTVTIWRAAVVLDRSDASLHGAMRELAETNAGLDLRVRERTADLASSEDRLRALLEEAALREATLRQSEERFRLAFDDALIGMSMASLEPSSLGRLLRVNPALCEFLGYSEAELLELTFMELTHPDDLPANKIAVEGFLSGQLTSWRTEKRYRHAAGHYVWGRLSTAVLTDEAGTPAYAVSQIEDITARKAAEASLTRQALHDALTGLPNRHLLEDHLTQALARAQRAGTQVGVLFLDLDNLKSVNDSLGHDAGDELLIEVGRRLVGALRGSDTAARLGGDEFVLVCEDVTHADELHGVAERVLRALDAETQIQGRRVGLSASMGLALSRRGSTPKDLLREADAAMYRAKQRGRGRWEIAEGELPVKA